jgi:WD40 repeat protein
LFRLTGHVGPVLAVTYSPDGAWVATGGVDRSIRLWNAFDGAPALALANHNGPVEALVFADNQTLYTASSDATLRVWAPATGRMKRILRGHDQPVLALDYSARRGLLLTGSADGSVRLTNPDTGEVVERVTIEDAAWPQAVAVSPDGFRMAWADTSGRHAIVRSNLKP